MALDLALVFGLIVLNAVFAGSELALISLREGQLRRLEKGGRRARRAARLARDPNRLLATIQVGITLAGFLASATAAVSLAEPLHEPLGFLGRAAEPAAVVLVTAVLSFLTLVLGELAPKRFALQRAEGWALAVATPLTLVTKVARPVVWLLATSTDLVLRLVGGDPDQRRDEVSEDELRELVEIQEAFTPQQREIIAGAFDIAERTLRTVLIPRREVISVAGTMAAGDACELLRTSGHSRAPVVERDLDDVSGVVHLRDLVGSDEMVASVARPPVVLPESLRVLDALRELQTRRESLAIVTNEYGGTEGIVTVEDLLEELVGEIYDESDRDVRQAQREPDGSFVLPGSFPMHDLDDIEVDLPGGEYATVAGLVLDRLGHLAEPGEVVDVNGWRIEVLDTDARAISRVRITRPADQPPAPAEPEA